MSDLTSTTEIVTFYVANGLTERMLATHVDDGTGHCAGCAWSQAAQPVHPCALRYCAEVAAEQERKPRPVSGAATTCALYAVPDSARNASTSSRSSP